MNLNQSFESNIKEKFLSFLQKNNVQKDFLGEVPAKEKLLPLYVSEEHKAKSLWNLNNTTMFIDTLKIKVVFHRDLV